MSLVGFAIEGLDELRASMKRVLAMGPDGLGLASTMIAEAETMMRLSKPLVPVVDGTARASGTVAAPIIRGDEVEVHLGYGGAASAYVLKLHENPRAGKTGGVSPSGKRYKRFSTVGQWKFLEQPVVARTQAYYDAIAAEVNKRLLGALT